MIRRSNVVVIFIVTACGMLASLCVMYFVGAHSIADLRKVAITRTALQHLQQTLCALVDAETGQRGFLLTGEESYLAPYHQALGLIRNEESALRQLAATGNLPSAEIDTLDSLTEKKLAELEHTIQQRKTGGLESALPLVRAGTGKATMDQIRDRIERLSKAKERELQQAYGRANLEVTLRTLTYFIVTAFNLIILVWACGTIRREVRARAAATLEISRQRELWHTTLASIGDGVIATDTAGRCTFLNSEAERLTGWQASEAAGQSLPDIFRIINERTRQPAENPVQKVLRTGQIVGLANHTILIAKNGGETPIDDSAAPIRHADGSLGGVVLVFRDFTAQREAQANAAHLAAIVENSGDAIITKNFQGIIQSWNASAERLFGYRAEEIVGQPVLRLFPPERQSEEDHILDRLRQGKLVERLETIRVAKDGRRIPVSVNVSPIKDADGQLVGASKIIHDISDLVAARQALVQEKELLATTLASIGDGVIISDETGRVKFLNAEAERLTGWSSQDAAGRTLPEIFRIVNEDTRQIVESPVDKVLRLGTVVGLANHTVLIAKDGRETPIDDSGAPIRTPGGPLFGVVLVFRDFTEHKETERKLRAARDQLADRAVHLENLVQERTARLNEMVGDLEAFSYSIVHDMRGPLRAIEGFAHLLTAECGAISATAEEHSRRIHTAIERMDRLIQDGLNFSYIIRGELPLTVVDAQALLRGIIETYPAGQRPQAEIEIEGDFPLVRANESALTQCFSNLLSNAVKFVAPGVTPKVRVLAELHGDCVRLLFRDNGIGIEKSAQEKIFQLFHQLSTRYEGTGLGLAIVKKAVQRMGGSVGVESSPGQGSTFWVQLTRAKVVEE